MKLLCVGRNGQLARALIERASDSNVSLVARGRPSLDILSPETIQAALDEISPDIVINTAAYTNVDAAEADEERVYAINRRAAGILAESTAEMNIPLIHVSTDYVFNGELARPYSETDEVSPLGVYGTSKLAGERAVIAANPQHVILRTAWLYSPFGNNFLKTMIRLAKRGKPIGVVEDQFGNPTNALDLADVILTICQRIKDSPQPRYWGTFHACSKGITTWAEFAQSIFRHSVNLNGPSVRVEPIPSADYPTPVARPAYSSLNCDKLTATFGVSLPNWQSSVGGTVARVLADQI